jgi:NADH:ubiquinone oxidoreductase subunit 4 (subunit M)
MCILIVAVLPAALPLERENLKSFVIGICFNLFCITINLLNSFDATKNGFQLAENYLVSPNYNLYFSVGIDGLNLSLLLLTA